MRFFVVLSTLVLLLVGGVVAACGPVNPLPNSQTVNIEVGDNYFKPNSIDTNQGVILQLTFKNVGSVDHTVQFPTFNLEKKIPVGQTVTASITSPTAQGRYPFSDPAYPTSMVGTLVVK